VRALWAAAPISRQTAQRLYHADVTAATSEETDGMYIGDKCHRVRPSRIRNVAIDCSLYLDGSDARILRDAGRRPLESLHPIPKRAIYAPALEHPTIVIPGSGSQRDGLPIKGQDDERAETTTGWRN